MISWEKVCVKTSHSELNLKFSEKKDINAHEVHPVVVWEDERINHNHVYFLVLINQMRDYKLL